MRWLLLVLAGCLPQLDVEGEIVVKGRHVTVYADPAIPVCAGAVAVADRFVEDTAAMLGIEPPAIDYYLFDGPTGCSYSQYENVSCAINGTVYANHWIHFHELVHAVDDSHPPALFVEGLAEALSKSSNDARGSTLVRALADVDLDSSSFRAGNPWDNYAVAGELVRYLIERFGPERYRAFARSLSSLADRITIRRQFQHTFDVSFEDLVADWRVADPTLSTLVVPVDLAACMDPVEPVAPDQWTGSGRGVEDCTSGETGNATAYTQYATRFGFEVTKPGLYAIQTDGDGDGPRGRVWSCASRRAHDYTVSSKRMTHVAVMPLVAGRHAIETVTPVSPWSVTRVGGVGETCETAPTVTAPDRAAWQLELSAPSRTWVRIANPGLHALRGTGTGAAARVCTGPCSALRCQAVGWPQPLAHHGGDPLLVELGTSSTRLPTVTLETMD